LGQDAGGHGIVASLNLWLKRQPFAGLYVVVLILTVLVITIFGTVRNFQIGSLEAASTILTLCAQVGATFAGFLIVAIVFIVERRRHDLATDWTFWDILDIAFLAAAMFVFTVVSLGSTIDLVSILNQSEVNSIVSGRVLRAIILFEIGTAAASSGVGFMLGIEVGKYRIHRASLQKAREKEAE
jgi:hypothetical protein